MGVYLKEFENHTQYENYINGSSAILPNVSFIEENNEVAYNPYDPYNGHEYVDLGLPSGTKWAKYNVGASSETAYGNYYQYGKGASRYQTTSGQSNYSGTESPLALSADTASQVMGGEWHMPTSNQFQELTARTTFEWVTINGVNGGKFTAANGNYVFFPATGYYLNGNKNNEGNVSCVWVSDDQSKNFADYFTINNTGGHKTNLEKSRGYSVRGVVG